jgi:hypothetical protein
MGGVYLGHRFLAVSAHRHEVRRENPLFRKTLSRLSLVLLVVVGGYLLLVTIVRLLPAPAGQREAVELLRQPIPPVRGRDATYALWLQKHDVPVAMQDRVGRALLEYYRADPAHSEAAIGPGHPLANYPQLPDMAIDEPGTCEQMKPGCLDHVRSDMGTVQATLAKYPRGLANALNLRNFDGMRYGLDPAELTKPLQPFGAYRRLVNTHFAAMFTTGKQTEALTGLCEDIAAWRRLGADNDSLIASMVAAGTVRRGVFLLGEMLAEVPPGEALPASCTKALADSTDAEFDMCPAMKTEFAFASARMHSPGDSDMSMAQRVLGPVFMDLRDVDGRSAIAMSEFCGEQVVARMRADQPTRSWPDRDQVKCKTFANIVNPTGCLFIDIWAPSGLEPYVDRRTDLAAILALGRTVVWLRQQEAEAADWPALLKKRPASLGLRREPSISADGRSISIPLWSQSGDDRFSWPLK